MIHLDETAHGIERLESLREILRGYPGKKGMKLRLDMADGGSFLLDCPRKVELNSEMRARIDDLLGPGHFRLVGGAPPTKAPQRRGRERARG